MLLSAFNVQVSVWTYVFISLGYIRFWVELLGHMVTLCLTFWATARLCSKLPLAMYEGSTFPTSSPALASISLINGSGCEVVSQCVWMYISLIIMMLSTFSCVFLYIFLEKCLFRSITCVFIIVLWVFLYILDTSSFSHIWFLIIFLHSAGYLFTFLIMSFVAQVFSSDVVQFIFFVFVACDVFDVISKKPFPNLRHEYLYLHFLPRVL